MSKHYTKSTRAFMMPVSFPSITKAEQVWTAWDNAFFRNKYHRSHQYLGRKEDPVPTRQ